MTAPKTDRRILRTRALLRQGLAELMQEKNAGDITVKELVAHANVNRSTFYLHYTDIDQMLASVEAELLERIEASVQAHPIDPHQAQIFPLVGDLFALMAENREICAALLGPHGDMAFLLQIEAILSRYSLQVLADAYPDRRADLDSGYSFCLSGCVGLIKNWLQAEEPAPPEVMAQRTYRLIHNAMRGLCPGGGSMKKKLQPAITLLQQYMAQDMTVYAGHATLFLLTAFFPLLMWLLVVVNTLPGFTVDSVVELFFRFLPDIPVIRDTIAGLITSMNENSNTFVASLAVVTTLVSASSGMAAIQKGLQKLTPGSRRTMLDRLWAVVYTFAFLWLLLIVLFCQNLSPLLHWALSLLPWLSQSHLFLRLHSLVSFSALAAFGLSILTFVLIYTFVPGGRRRMRDQLPGALFTAVVWFVFSSIFTYYIRTSWKLSYIYGSLTSIILVILWLNVSINVMFLGAGVNGMCAYSRRNG